MLLSLNDIFSLIRDIIVAISAAIVAILAFWGLNRWRKEIAGKAKFDLVRQIMLINNKFVNSFIAARNVFTYSGESAGRERKEGESVQETLTLNEWYARANRVRPMAENLEKLQELGWEAESLLDIESNKQVTKTIKIYRELYAEVLTSINSYFQTQHEEITRSRQYNNQEWLQKLHKMIYGLENNDISKRIIDAKENLATVLKKFVK
jgi:hypothetical protein